MSSIIDTFFIPTSVHCRSGMIALSTVALLALGGCQTTKEDVGTVVGTVIGVGIGALIGGDAAGAFIGGAAGMLAGNIIGSELDREDQLKAEAAADKALAAKGPANVSWKSDQNKGTYGQISTTKPSIDNFGSECRDVEQIYYKLGNRHEVSDKFCLVDGKWQRA